ncbi:Pro-kumamolisin, activation domain-containing protein [Lactarius pseudohatsudake]|nr:Pro-kumamolisin, activation domain-containing protein [Lactarius pseudohatsudake]
MFSVLTYPLSVHLAPLTPSQHALHQLSVLAAVPLVNFATPLTPSWETLSPPPVGTSIDLHNALKPQDQNALIDALYEVSTPRSPKHVLSNTPRTIYRAHLSKEEVAKLIAPHPDTLELVHSWFAHHSVESSSISTTHGGSWLTVTGVPVSQANELLGASYELYWRTGTNDTTILRTIGYAQPVAPHMHMQNVVSTTYFASMGTLLQTPRRRSVGDVGLYSGRKRPEYARDRGLRGDYSSPADLETFTLKRRTDADDRTFNVVRINGGEYDLSKPDKEPNQNIQYALAVGY